MNTTTAIALLALLLTIAAPASAWAEESPTPVRCAAAAEDPTNISAYQDPNVGTVILLDGCEVAPRW